MGLVGTHTAVSRSLSLALSEFDCSPLTFCPLQLTSSQFSTNPSSGLGASVPSIPDYVYSQLSNPQVTSPEAKKLHQDICALSQRGENLRFGFYYFNYLSALAEVVGFNSTAPFQ